MIRLRLKRFPSGAVQTLGRIEILDATGKVVSEKHSLELAWKNNESRVSCIPNGIYWCEKVKANDPNTRIKYEHLWIKDVPDRGGIKIHKGNFYNQILGCVLPGESLADINGDGVMDVVNSTQALNDMLYLLPDRFQIEIIWLKLEDTK